MPEKDAQIVSRTTVDSNKYESSCVIKAERTINNRVRFVVVKDNSITEEIKALGEEEINKLFVKLQNKYYGKVIHKKVLI